MYLCSVSTDLDRLTSVTQLQWAKNIGTEENKEYESPEAVDWLRYSSFVRSAEYNEWMAEAKKKRKNKYYAYVPADNLY